MGDGGSFWFFFFQEKELKTRYGVRFGHGEVAVLYAVGLVAPGGVHDWMWETGQVTADMTEYDKARVYFAWICERKADG